MKVVSIKEPFATLIKEKRKCIETRSWKTNYRGELYIHASGKSLAKEFINDNVLKLNIDILLDNLKLKEPKKEDSMIETLDDLFLEVDDRKEELNVPIEESKEESEEEKTTDQQEIDIQSESLFSNLDKSKETYETYSVYIMRDNDSLEEIINKYNTSREKLEEYNNLNEIKIGTKLIIPNTKNE